MKAETRTHVAGMLFILAAITAWGVYFPFAKLILEKLSPMVFLVFRLGIGALVLISLGIHRGTSFAVRRPDLGIVLLAGLIGIVLHQLVQVIGLQHTTATNTGWILTLIPPMSGFLGWVFLREGIALRQIAGLVVAMIGVVYFVSRGAPTELSFIRNIGDVLALASVVTWSVYTVMTKSRLTTYDSLPMSGIHMGVGFVVFLLIGAWRIPSEVAALDAAEWLIVILIGIIPSGLAYCWWFAGLKRLSVIRTSTFLFIEAVITSLTGFLLLGERFTTPMVAAAVVIIVGVWVTQARRD
jgi:drug/metabolite transporter (DMT)-like permease